MVDFVKAGIFDRALAADLKAHSLLSFKGQFDIKTGVANENDVTAKCENVQFRIRGGYIEMTGSLHYLFNKLNNNGHQNYNDFSLSDIRWTIEYLRRTFNIDPQKMRVHNFEFGYNIKTFFEPNAF